MEISGSFVEEISFLINTIVNYPMNNKMFFLKWIGVWGLFIMIAFTSCSDDNDGTWPATAENLSADFVTSSSVYYTVNFTGQMNTVEEAGFCWSTNDPPDINDIVFELEPLEGLHQFRSVGLMEGENYFVRAYYVHNEEVYYSSTVAFTTPTAVQDSDGNSYSVVKIGNQSWMRDNLKVITYNNGDSITDGTGRGNYSAVPGPKYYFHYNDNAENSTPYGQLYTWYTISDQRGLCPPQWRVPDVTDWDQLIGHLDELSVGYNEFQAGGQELSAIAGGMIRSTGTIEEGNGLWYEPNRGANNVTRMNVIPTGLRDPSGSFDGLGYNAAFWSFTENDTTTALMFYTHYFNPGIHANTFSKSSGYAVRCVR